MVPASLSDDTKRVCAPQHILPLLSNTAPPANDNTADARQKYETTNYTTLAHIQGNILLLTYSPLEL